MDTGQIVMLKSDFGGDFGEDKAKLDPKTHAAIVARQVFVAPFQAMTNGEAAGITSLITAVSLLQTILEAWGKLPTDYKENIKKSLLEAKIDETKTDMLTKLDIANIKLKALLKVLYSETTQEIDIEV
jgi:hypothetical protein